MSLPNRKVPKNFPCSCGHPWSKHDWAGPSIGDEFCMGGGKNTKYFSALCDCMMFVPDNLKYLEQCIKKRGKIT